MSRFWSARVRELVPYVPGEQPKISNLIKLNTNEHPFGPSPKAIAAMQAALNDDLRLYPDPNADALRQTISDYYDLAAQGGDPSWVFVGNGSDEVLAHAFHGLFQHDKPLLFPDISYSFYPVYAQLYDIAYETVPLTDSFVINPADYSRANGGVIFPNPNAPTGCVLALDAIEQILQANRDVVVLVDEAYIDFGGDSAVALVGRYDNLLITQTLSKSRALAGLRVGLAIGQPHLIEALERIKNSFNSYPLGRVALAGAQAAFEDKAYFDSMQQMVIMQRDSLTAKLERLGFDVLPSGANFVFAQHPKHGGADLAQALRERAVVVRHFNKPRIDNFLRITVGTPDQHAALIDALSEILA
ncbi:histidinol-phosphate transaminase [Paraperlucidibaca sp.]|uniref:histidinol-phosphate transaminase n=1 Tax=Paraperlucidibaca sp. TaxID=2708021 RepID=UPI0030F456C2